jgi:putative SOS response-associated peptidase YedK
MCGRYSSGEKITIKTRFTQEKTFHLPRRYNICPTQTVPVIVLKKGQLVDQTMRWGLIPKWAKNRSVPPIINVKSETVLEKFSGSAQNRRCLVPADGFYEWENSQVGKLPWRFILKDEQPFCFAGIYDQWQPPSELDNEPPPPIDTFAILTTEPNALVRKVHNRMPLILHEEHYDFWLDPDSTKDGFKRALQIFPAEWMQSYRVSKTVNQPKNESPDCLKPV